MNECATNPSSEAWEEFIRRFQRTMALAIMRTAAQYGKNDKDTVDELVQETLLKLCANERALLRNFQARHENAVAAFLRVVSTNVAHDHLRTQVSAKRGANKISQFEVEHEVADANSTRLPADQLDRTVLLGELHCKLQQLLAGEEFTRDRLIFRLYFGLGLTAEAISRRPDVGLSAKGVETALLRMVKLLRERIRGSSVELR